MIGGGPKISPLQHRLDQPRPALSHRRLEGGGKGGMAFRPYRLHAHALGKLHPIEIGIADVEHRLTPGTDTAEADARRRGIDLASTVPTAVTALCAPEKVERVLFNLLTNALRHTPTDGAVAVRVDRVDGQVQVSVEDTGDGLGEEARARMFDRFWRGDPARSARGAGLGLAIARGLVEAHGGRIWAEERPEGGARVSFTLPAAP